MLIVTRTQKKKQKLRQNRARTMRIRIIISRSLKMLLEIETAEKVALVSGEILAYLHIIARIGTIVLPLLKQMGGKGTASNSIMKFAVINSLRDVLDEWNVNRGDCIIVN
mmetsp:Transcript_6314/g.10483  ORF Transcript_6314/g.10483 Transcript_6314/m.10483 type:complete len:110 (+) Transcript_6314:264-593(+)